MSGKILNKVQAQTVYDAMCELNNINAQLQANIDYVSPGTTKRVFSRENGFVQVIKLVNYSVLNTEVYQSQDEFRSKYGLAV